MGWPWSVLEDHVNMMSLFLTFHEVFTFHFVNDKLKRIMVQLMSHMGAAIGLPSALAMHLSSSVRRSKISRTSAFASSIKL